MIKCKSVLKIVGQMSIRFNILPRTLQELWVTKRQSMIWKLQLQNTKVSLQPVFKCIMMVNLLLVSQRRLKIYLHLIHQFLFRLLKSTMGAEAVAEEKKQIQLLIQRVLEENLLKELEELILNNLLPLQHPRNLFRILNMSTELLT